MYDDQHRKYPQHAIVFNSTYFSLKILENRTTKIIHSSQKSKLLQNMKNHQRKEKHKKNSFDSKKY